MSTAELEEPSRGEAKDDMAAGGREEGGDGSRPTSVETTAGGPSMEGDERPEAENVGDCLPPPPPAPPIASKYSGVPRSSSAE